MKIRSFPLLLLAVCSLACAAEPGIPANPLPQVDAAEIVSTVTYDLGDRFLTVEQVTDAILPTPPKMVKPAPAIPAASPQGFSPSFAYEFVSMGVVTYLSNSAPPRSLVTYHPKGGEAVEFWSSADWRLLTGLGSFTAEDGKEWGVLMMPEVIDVEKSKALYARHGETYHPPVIPAFTGREATYIITRGQPSEGQLEPIDALHLLYDNNRANLLAAFNAREAARIQREAELEANPPVAADITVRSRMLTPQEIEATKAD